MNKNEIEIIKNQINLKMKTNSNSDRDLLVFRPKINLLNPILTKKDHNMSSIFELQNKRKNEAFLLRIRQNNKENYQKQIQIQDHLHIQRCKTFKKYNKNKVKNKNILQHYQTFTAREKSRKQSIKVSLNLKNMQIDSSEKIIGNNLSHRKQKKIIFDNFPLNSIRKQIEKQNKGKLVPKSSSKPTTAETNFLEKISVQWLKGRMKEKSQNSNVRKSKDSHKRMQTEIPNILGQINKQQKFQVYIRKPFTKFDENYLFKPWETTQIYQKQSQFFQL